MSSYKEKKLANSYSRKDFFELLETSFEINSRRRDNYSNQEVFSDNGSKNQESFDFTIGYFYYDEPVHVREIYITTWDGGWDYLKRCLHLETSHKHDGWDLKRDFRNSKGNSDGKFNLFLENIPKLDIIPQIIDYFQN